MLKGCLELRTYIRCNIMKSKGKSCVEDHLADNHDPERVTLPAGTRWFDSFDLVEGFAIVDGATIPVRSKSFNHSSGKYYLHTTVFTPKEYAAGFPDSDYISQLQGWKSAKIVCISNVWYILDPQDVVLERTS